MIDAHIHLDYYPIETIDRRIHEWRQAGVTHVVAVSKGLTSAYRTLELKYRYPDFVLAAIGYHPEQEPATGAELTELVAVIDQEAELIHAVGEVGLPHYASEQLSPSRFERHVDVFQSFIKIAKKRQLPLAIHAVHEQAPIAQRMLQEEGVSKAHFHWLKATPQTVKEIINAGYFISFTPEVCYRERDQQLARLVPLEQMLIETDGPWPFSGPFQEKETTPLLLKNVCETLAHIKNVSSAEAAVQFTKNTRSVYQCL